MYLYFTHNISLNHESTTSLYKLNIAISLITMQFQGELFKMPNTQWNKMKGE
jgi:hypothetical protein